MRKLAAILTLALMLAGAPAWAKINAVACEPEWGALLHELGGEQVAVFVATAAHQDPHRIEPRPSLIAKMRNAELLVCTGAELEAGWLPVLLQQAGRRVQPGQPGYFEAARFVELMDKPASVDRAQGDVHAAGNPHIHTDPRNIARVASALSERLVQLDPANSAHYRGQYADFDRRWQAAMTRWDNHKMALKSMPIVAHHTGWAYLVRWLELRQVALLEPRPGVPPSVSHLTALVAQLKSVPARVIVRAPYEDARASAWLSERTAIPAIALPYTVGGSPEAKDLFALFDATLNQLSRHAPSGTGQ